MSLADQVHFSNKSSCTEWKPNNFKKEKCSSCSYLFTDHEAANVTDSQISDYLDNLNAKNPCNEVLPASDGKGVLYLGSFQALSETNIAKYKISHGV